MVLNRVVGSPAGGQIAILVQPGVQPAQLTAATEQRVEVGGTMYGGTLVLIDPSGAVTEKDGQLRFHAFGVPLQQCEPLSDEGAQARHWAVYDELMKLERQATGISRVPG